MKNTFDKKEALAYFQKLTAGGKKLSIRWEAGLEELWPFLYLDDQLIDNDDFALQFGYFLLATNNYGPRFDRYHAAGHLEFDRQKGYLVGTEFYSEAIIKTDQINFEIQVPTEVWFDELRILIHFRYEDQETTTEVEFSLQNGPKHEMYPFLEDEILGQLIVSVNEFLGNIHDEILAMHDEFRIQREQFVEKDGVLKFAITELRFSYNKEVSKELVIDLTTA